MTDTLTPATLDELHGAHPAPCLSLYQPTHRHSPDNQQDPIRFRNLLKTLANSLSRQYPTSEIRSLLEPLDALAQNFEFWNHTLDGLAVLRGPQLLRVFRVQRPVPELAVVADSFHTKPLRRFLQSVDRYHVLGLSRSGLRMFEGNRDALDEIEPDEAVPRTLSDALGDELTQPRQTISSYGGRTGANGAMHHGHGGRKDEVDHDAERFFRIIDRAVLEHHSKPTQLPLVLAALTEHHHLFRSVSQNPLLMDSAIAVNPDAISLEELRRRTWELVEPSYRARQQALVDAFAKARSTGLGSDELAQVATSAAEGRVATLLIEAERQIAGRLDPESGRIEAGDLDHPEVDDLLDDLALLVEQRGGEVQVLPPERMAGSTGVAAIYRH